MPLFEQLVDNFNDNEIGPEWGDSYGGATETGGRARVPLVATVYAGYQTGRAWTLAGSHVYLKLATVPAVSTGTDVSANFSVTSAVEGTSVGFKYNAVTGKLRLQSNTDYYDPAAVEITYDPVAHAWLRLVEDGTNLTWSTSPDGTTWTTRRTLATPAWITAAIDTCALDLYSYRDAGATDFTEYDNVNTLSDGAVLAGAFTAAFESNASATGARTAIGAFTASAETSVALDVLLVAHGAFTATGSLTATVEPYLDLKTDPDAVVGWPRLGWKVGGPW